MWKPAFTVLDRDTSKALSVIDMLRRLVIRLVTGKDAFSQHDVDADEGFWTNEPLSSSLADPQPSGRDLCIVSTLLGSLASRCDVGRRRHTACVPKSTVPVLTPIMHRVGLRLHLVPRQSEP